MSNNRGNVNAAELREALESTEELLEHFAKPGTMLGDAFALHMRDNRAALAEPPRNCDVGTVEEQTRRLRANCEKYKPSCKGCKFFTDIQRENCWLKWAQMPYEKRDTE